MPTQLIEDETELAEIVRSARVVAVVGMKDGRNPDAPAYAIPKRLQALGLRVLPVNPSFVSALGERAYTTLAALPERPDIVDFFRRPGAIGRHVDEIMELPPDRRPAVVWMQTGIRNDEAAARLTAAGIRVVMDRCLGVYAGRYRRGGSTTPSG